MKFSGLIAQPASSWHTRRRIRECPHTGNKSNGRRLRGTPNMLAVIIAMSWFSHWVNSILPFLQWPDESGMMNSAVTSISEAELYSHLKQSPASFSALNEQILDIVILDSSEHAYNLSSTRFLSSLSCGPVMSTRQEPFRGNIPHIRMGILCGCLCRQCPSDSGRQRLLCRVPQHICPAAQPEQPLLRRSPYESQRTARHPK